MDKLYNNRPNLNNSFYQCLVERINELSDMEREVYQILREEPTIRQIDLANRLDLTEQYIRKLIKKLKEHGWIERIGAKKNGYWKIIEKP